MFCDIFTCSANPISRSKRFNLRDGNAGRGAAGNHEDLPSALEEAKNAMFASMREKALQKKREAEES